MSPACSRPLQTCGERSRTRAGPCTALLYGAFARAFLRRFCSGAPSGAFLSGYSFCAPPLTNVHYLPPGVILGLRVRQGYEGSYRRRAQHKSIFHDTPAILLSHAMLIPIAATRAAISRTRKTVGGKAFRNGWKCFKLKRISRCRRVAQLSSCK